MRNVTKLVEWAQHSGICVAQKASSKVSISLPRYSRLVAASGLLTRLALLMSLNVAEVVNERAGGDEERTNRGMGRQR